MRTRPPTKIGFGVDVDWVLPADLVAVLLFVGLADGLLVGLPTDLAPLRAVVALPVLLFVPGYVLLAAFYPRRADGAGADSTGLADTTASTERREAFGVRSIGWTERVALSFGLSVALVPVIGLAVAPLAGALTLEPILLSVSTFAVAVAVVAVVRRNGVPADERFRVPFRRWAGTLRAAIFGRPSRIDGVLTALVLVSVVVAASTMGLALLAPQEGESYTSVTLLTENADGDLVAEGYPTELERGDAAELVLRVDNHERAERTYTFVVELQRVDASGDAVSVTEDEVIARDGNTVAAGDTWMASHTVEPTMTGEDLRVAYYLYRGEPPADPNEETAYRHLYIWIDVSDAGASG